MTSTGTVSFAHSALDCVSPQWETGNIRRMSGRVFLLVFRRNQLGLSPSKRSRWGGLPLSRFRGWRWQIALFSNGTLSLELAFAALGIAFGEAITTSFTFIATAHTIA